MSKAARPWVQWYWSDWRSDPGLRVCSLAARGLWAELLGIMHESATYGHLLIGGNPPTPRQIASMVGCTAGQVEALVAELRAAGVPSFTDEGVMFCRRMVRDREKQDRDKANGKRGGNPRLKGGVNPPDKGADKAHIPEARSQKEKQDAAPNGAPPVVEFPSPEKRYFDRGKEVLGRASGGLLTKLLHHHGDNVPLAVATVEVASTKSDPREYIGAVLARHGDGDVRPDGLRPGRDVF